MKLGKVKWYGTYNSFYESYNEYGFIEPIEKTGDIYFHKKGIAQGSLFLEKYNGWNHNCYVVYEPALSVRGKLCAQNVRLLEEVDADGQEEIFRQYDNNPMIQEELRERFPEWYFKEEMKPYFDEMFRRSLIKKLFLERYRNGYFKQSFCREYGSWIQEYSTSYQRWELEALLQEIDIKKEMVEDVVFLAEKAKERGLSVEKILEQRPELLIDSEEYLEAASDALLRDIVSGMQWENSDETYRNRYRAFLRGIEADEKEKAALQIAVSMRKAALDLEWWKLLTDSVKIRVLIYCSNDKEEIGLESLKRLYEWESGQENDLLLAVLLFFINQDLSLEPDGKRQKLFEEAHGRLMNYITDSFSKERKISHGLNTLLEKCWQDYRCGVYFCDAKLWKAQNKIYCPEGECRPNGGRRACVYYKDMDLSKTKYKSTKNNLTDQHLMDFLLNVGYESDLSFIHIGSIYEYPYRISAFVNRLIDMEPHMKCEKCGHRFYADFTYSAKVEAKLSATIFYCPDCGDNKVYLNYCNSCHRVIDTRECKKRDSFGEYLCMHCGATEHIPAGRVCPSCMNDDHRRIRLYGSDRIACEKCGYDAAHFKSWMEVLQEKLLAGSMEGEELPFY